MSNKEAEVKKKTEDQKKQLNKGCLAIAFLHWMITFFSDRLIFQYALWDFSDRTQTIKTAVAYGAKAVFLLVLIGIWHGIFYFFKKADRKFVCCTLLYFALNLCLLLSAWPGIWRMDEFGILNSALHLFPVFWQHYLTSVFYVFSLMLLPFPSGVIIIQCVCVSLVAAYVVTWFVKRCGKGGYIIFIPFCFLPVLDSNLYPMRMSLYAFLELWLLILICQRYLKATEKEGNFVFCALAAIVTVWRTESVYYVLLFPLLLWILFRKHWDKKYLFQTVCAYLVMTLVLYLPQKSGDMLTNGSQYDLTSVVLPLVPLTERAYEDFCLDGISCRDELAAIDSVVNVEVMLEGAKEGKNGINLFWGEPAFQRTQYGNEEYKQFKKAYYSLILKYPDVFLKERWSCFVQSVDLLQDTTKLFTEEGIQNYETFRGYPMTGPLNNGLRTAVISFMEWRSQTDYMQKKAGYGFVYGPFFPIFILLLCWGFCLIRGKWGEFFILSLPLVKLPLIFLTAPSRLFMYYYSLYLIGWVLLFYVLLKLWIKVWGKIGAPVTRTLRYARRNGIKKAFYAAMERVDHVNTDALMKKAAAYRGCREWARPKEDEGKDAPKNEQKDHIKISIVVPAYETDPRYMAELIDCVKKQTYSDWELIIADASRSDAVKKAVSTARDAEDRQECADQNKEEGSPITYIRLKENNGISENTNAGIEAATGDYIALLDHDDLLTFDALEKMVSRLYQEDVKNRASVLAVYSDEDKCDGSAARFYEPNFKPDFNLELLLSNNYICHFLMVRADIMKELGLRTEYDGAQDYDLLLRLALMTEAAKSMTNPKRDSGQNGRQEENGQKKGMILHTPYVLYHWRCHEQSTAVNTDSKRYAYDAGREALKAFYRSVGLEASTEVTDSDHLGFYHTEYKPDIFSARRDVAALCGRVTEKGIVTASPDGLFDGLKSYSSGYLHRADFRMEVKACDERALRIRPDLEISLKEALEQGMKLLYDPCVVNEHDI